MLVESFLTKWFHTLQGKDHKHLKIAIHTPSSLEELLVWILTRKVANTSGLAELRDLKFSCRWADGCGIHHWGGFPRNPVWHPYHFTEKGQAEHFCYRFFTSASLLLKSGQHLLQQMTVHHSYLGATCRAISVSQNLARSHKGQQGTLSSRLYNRNLVTIEYICKAFHGCQFIFTY